MTNFLTTDDVLILHDALIDAFGGSHGLRDAGLLDSALAQPQASMYGQLLHETLTLQAAAYMFHVIKNHAFIDGNKRTGYTTASLFFQVNGYKLTLAENVLIELALGVAAGGLTKQQIAQVFEQHLESLD
jgi:death-on-curing protein